MRKLSVITALLTLTALSAFAQSAHPCSAHDQFWAHVYTPERLTVQEHCVSVTGVIVDATSGKRKDGQRHEKDGDNNGWLKLDPGQAKYLNAGNRSHEGGNLVFEVACKYPVGQSDAVAACEGYESPVQIPPVGTHVRITGSWVQDDNHARWLEVHPVFLIEVLDASVSAMLRK